MARLVLVLGPLVLGAVHLVVEVVRQVLAARLLLVPAPLASGVPLLVLGAVHLVVEVVLLVLVAFHLVVEVVRSYLGS